MCAVLTPAGADYAVAAADPLGLGKDPEALRWYVQAELFHGRTAMTAVAGILIPSVSTSTAAQGGP